MAKKTTLNNRTCTVEVYEDSPEVPGGFHVTYKPSAFQQTLLARCEELGEAEKQSERLAANTELIVSLVTGWNYETDESTPEKPEYLPVTEAEVIDLGIPTQNDIIQAIVADIRLGEERKRDSSSTS